MEFYSATKKNEIVSFGGKWMELENIILSQTGSEGQKLPVLLHMRIINLKKFNNITGHGSHTKGRTHMGRKGKGKET
jgi:hypothetical protein